MNIEMGEYLVGAYLKVIEKCDFVDYGVRFPGGKLRGLSEIDVVGLRFEDASAFLCEVITHVQGLLYEDYPTTVKRIRAKFRNQQQYADERLKQFKTHRFMLWSPVVSYGLVTRLGEISGLDMVINQEYGRRIRELRARAKATTHDVGNPAFRLLTIIEHVRM